MHKILISFFSVLMVVGAARADVVESNLYHCISQVEGFTGFTVKQINDTSVENSQPKYALKVDWTFDDVWNESGHAQFSPEGTLVFQSQFEKKPLPPADDSGLFPAPTRPTWEEETLYIFVSINKSLTGSLSIHSDLQPIRCEKLFQ